MTVARGHIVIRRKAKDGTNGADGSQGPRVEFCTYSSGKAYCSGAVGESVYHIAFHATYQQFFRCIQSYPATETHAPTQSGSNAYWEWQQGLEQLFIDMLCANEAFLNNLVVRHMYTTDGKCQILEGGLLKAVGAYLTDVKILGTLRSAFVRHDGSFTWDDTKSMAMLHDNLLMAGGGSMILAAGGLPWDSGQSGRRITITIHRYNGTLSTGAVEFTAATGKYFFEDGLCKSTLKLSSREFVELLGIGEDETFYGWIVTNRGDIETNGRYGKRQKVLVNGVVKYTGDGSNHSCKLTYKSFDGSTVSACCMSTTGRYRITLPSWGLSESDYMVMLSPIGRAYDSTSGSVIKAAVMDQYSSYFFVETSDDSTNNWGGGFNFQVINLNDWL